VAWWQCFALQLLFLFYGLGRGNYANFFGKKSPMLTRVLAISAGSGGLTREFWVVFEEIILKMGKEVERMGLRKFKFFSYAFNLTPPNDL
jgi:hypothetical protein